MEPTAETKDKISKEIWQKFYPAYERHPLLQALLLYGTPQAAMAHALEISKQAMSFYITGQRRLPPKHELKLLGLLWVCHSYAVNLLGAMERNLTADDLGPYARRPNEEEILQLKLAIEYAGKAMTTIGTTGS